MSGLTSAGAQPATSRPILDRFKSDLLASLVVFLVALPLCMGIAVASGAPPAAGLITGIVGGLLVGWLAGAPLQVSGPAAGLTVIVFEQIQHHGLAVLAVLVLAAGAIQFAAGLAKLGQWFRAVSPAVIEGMLAGIGVLIVASQTHVLLGGAPKGSGLENALRLRDELNAEFLSMDGWRHLWQAAIGLVAIAAVVGWQRWAPKTVRLIPAALMAVVACSILGRVLPVEIDCLRVPENLLGTLSPPTWDQLSILADRSVLASAVAMAVIASAETLLCATAVDAMHTGERTNYDRELAVQGLGNMVCGLLGALPMTGVIVRSGANVQAGARTRLSAVLHGVWLLLFAILLPGLLAYIPVAALAGVLIVTGYKLINAKAVRHLASFGAGEVAVFIVTMTTIVCTDLLTGVLTGLGLSVVKLLHRFSRLEVRQQHGVNRQEIHLFLDGAATFIRLPILAAALQKIPQRAHLRVHLDELDYIDHACLELLMTWEKQHHAQGGRLEVDWSSLRAKFDGGQGRLAEPRAPSTRRPRAA